MDKLSYKLESFEGPLDLLLHLIAKNKLNIYDINICELVSQYLDCINKMKELKKEGKTMVFVTHSLGSAQELCDRSIWLSNGIIKMDGDTNAIIEKYIEETK